MVTKEEKNWEAAAAAYDEGEGLPLDEVNPDNPSEMSELYLILEVETFAARKRLQRFVRRLQQQRKRRQQQQISSSSSTEEIKEIVDFVRAKKAETETLIISVPKTERFNAAMHQLDFKKDAAEWMDKPSFNDPPSQPHVWLKSNEDSPENRAAYMKYLRNPDNIRLPRGTKLFEGSSDKDLLSVVFFGFGNVKTSGKVDVILTSSRHQSIATVRQNILVGIELKKDTNHEYSKIERQVVLQHLAASYLNADTGILTIMTDLKDRWHFFWFAEGKLLMRYEATRTEATFLIQHSQNEQGQTSTPTSFLNRACWNDLFSSQLCDIEEVKSIDEVGDEDEDHEQRWDGNAGGNSFSQSGGRSVSQQRTPGDSWRASRHGKSGGSKGGDRKHTQMDDTSLEYMDKEERFEATLRRELQTSFHKVLYVPEVEERRSVDVLPREIRLG